MAEDTKKWYQSKTIISDILTFVVGAYAVLVPILGAHGIHLPPLESGWLATILSFLAGMGIIGRATATTPVKVVPPLRNRLIVWVLVQAIKRRKFLWLATMAARYVALNLHVNKETKTWSLESLPMFHPEQQERNYDDIAAIFKSKPENYKVTEEKTPEGKFKSFTIETG